jgi:hypothetical protein
VNRCIGLSGSDRKFPGVDRPIGHAPGMPSAVARDAWHLGALVLATTQLHTHHERVLVRCLRVQPRASFRLTGYCWRRPLAVDGGSGTSRGHAWGMPVMRWPGARRCDAITRPSAFQAGHIPSRRGSCERYALPPVAVAAGGRWSLLLLPPLLSAWVVRAGVRA